MPLRSALSYNRMEDDDVTRVAFIGSYLPRKCGIATFTHDLRHAVGDTFPDLKCYVLAMNDIKDGYSYTDDVRFELDEQDPTSYLRAADYINQSNVNVVCVQHEYGIYGGECGVMLLPFLKALKVPIVTTLHTILEQPSVQQKRIMGSILSISSRVITMARKGAELLKRVYNAEMGKISIVPHGIPEMEFPDTERYKAEHGFEGKRVVLTFGLLSPNKGIEFAIRAMAKVVAKFPNTVYVVLGQTHPGIIRDHGEMYRHGLQHLAEELGISSNVVFLDQFVDLPMLKTYIAACDVYLTPYLHEAQITSGTLSYAFGMGSVVVSTPYWHAAELLDDGRGIIVPFRDSELMGTALVEILGDDAKRAAMKQRAFEYGRSMTWSETAELYMESFKHAVSNYKRVEVPEPFHTTLPNVNLAHLHRLTDDTSIIQHAKFSIPHRDHGYCIDDTARALLLLTQMQRHRFDLSPQTRSLISVYLAFIAHAWEPKSNRFHNFMSYDRKWLDKVGSEDSHGRTLQALGACVRFGVHVELTTELFLYAMHVAGDLKYPRSWAFALMGLRDFVIATDHHEAKAIQRDLFERLVATYRANSSEFSTDPDVDKNSWLWFEDMATYDNPILPQAMIVTADQLGDEAVLEMGLRSLKWLFDRQVIGDRFVPIGCQGWLKKSGERALYDQQPLEPGSMVLACTSAWHVTNDDVWHRRARLAFDWFMGKNLIGKALYDPETGGCCDGMHDGSLNANRGAESLLMFLMALVALKTDEVGAADAQKQSTDSLLTHVKTPLTSDKPAFAVNAGAFPVSNSSV